MNDFDFEKLAEQEKLLAQQEIEKMEQTVKEYKQQLELQQKEIMEQIIDENNEENNSKKSTLLIFLILFVILAGSFLSIYVYKPASNYRKAVEMLENGNYDGAKAVFVSLDDYKDARQMVKECDYKKGNYLLATGKYNLALTALSGIEGYKERDALLADLAGTSHQTIAIGKGHSAYIRSIGTVKAVGDNSNDQCNVSNWKNVVQLACGKDFTIALTADGMVYATNATVGWQGITSIAAGDNFFAGLRNDGTVFAWGKDVVVTDVVAISAAGDLLVCLKNNGTVEVIGENFNVDSWQNIIEVAADNNAVYALTADGNVLSTNNRLSDAKNIKHIFAAADTLVAIDKENNVLTAGVYTADVFDGMLMLSGYNDHFLLLHNSGNVRFVGQSSGADNVGDWADILFNPRK